MINTPATGPQAHDSLLSPILGRKHSILTKKNRQNSKKAYLKYNFRAIRHLILQKVEFLVRITRFTTIKYDSFVYRSLQLDNSNRVLLVLETGFKTSPSHHQQGIVCVCLGMIVLMHTSVSQARPHIWYFPDGATGWKGNHDVADLSVTRDGLTFQSMGHDPWIEGPTIHLPSDQITRVTVRMKSNADTSGELFYGPTFRAGHSVPFVIQNDDQWHDYVLIITESLGADTRFRLDPATGVGQLTVQSIVVESLLPAPTPPFEVPMGVPDQTVPVSQITSGLTTLTHFGRHVGDFTIDVNDFPMAVGYSSELLGVMLDGQPEWLNLGRAATEISLSEQQHLMVRASIKDSQGGTWQIEREIYADPTQSALVIQCRFTVDRDRDIILLPWLTLHCGLGTFGPHKDQAMLAGLEYLCDEPSSSQADITTPAHVRRIPDPLKVTFPLMAITEGGYYLGLVWEPSERTNPLFDSPDRLMGAQAHLLGVTGPAVGPSRFENDLAAYQSVGVTAHDTLETTCTIMTGQGHTVVPAVKHYVRMRGLPEVPTVAGGFDEVVTLLSQGWLASDIRSGGLFRHAVWYDLFKPGRAADAAMFMDWLSTSLPQDDPLAQDLRQARDQTLGEIPMSQAYTSSVSHVSLPSATLRFGKGDLFIRDTHNTALDALNGYTADGIQVYHPGETDFSTTHFADHANGYGAKNLVRILEGALVSMDTHLVQEALALLDKQTTLYANTVPRGAQTWEIPLHTPDILASAHLVKAYVYGHILSGRHDYLDQARYWAWTGVPFVYLVDPTDKPVGRYATIPVLGATHWVGSWFGRPVQWCGLVYASALHLLSEYDAKGPWQHIAMGITASGLQQCWPTEDLSRQGLLPDFFHLNSQTPDGPAINPGTVQAHVSELFGLGKMYQVKRLGNTRWIIHAPCQIDDVVTDNTSVQFTLAGWGGLNRNELYSIIISGLDHRPSQIHHCALNDHPQTWKAIPLHNTTYVQAHKALILRLQGPMTISLSIE